MEWTLVLTLLCLSLIIVQVVILVKTYLLVRKTSRMLYELKFFLARYYPKKSEKYSESRICRNCKFRMTYIHISEGVHDNAFYYQCKLHKREITLKDSCPNFKRYLASKRKP